MRQASLLFPPLALAALVLLACGRDAKPTRPDPGEGPPAPRALYGDFDPVTGIVRLSWPPVKSRGLMGYFVYSSEEKGVPPRKRFERFLTDTVYFDSALFHAPEYHPYPREWNPTFFVKAIDSNWVESPVFSPSLKANLANVTAMRPQIHFSSDAFEFRTLAGEFISIKAAFTLRKSKVLSARWNSPPEGRFDPLPESRDDSSLRSTEARFRFDRPGLKNLTLVLDLGKGLSVTENLQVRVYADAEKCRCVKFPEARLLGHHAISPDPSSRFVTDSLPFFDIGGFGLGFEVPRSFRDRNDAFEARLLVPIETPTTLENPVIPIDLLERRTHPSPEKVHHLVPGGYVPLPWRSFQGAGGYLDIRESLTEFNAQPAEKRHWVGAAEGQAASTGSFRFTFGRPSLIPVLNSFQAQNSEALRSRFSGEAERPRAIEKVYGRSKPVFFSSASNPLKDICYTEPVAGQELEFPFFEMPALWAQKRRRKSVVLEIRWRDRVTDSLRTYTSLAQGDLGFTLAAPSIQISGLYFDYLPDARLRRGPLHWEGMLAGEKPVDRDMDFWVSADANFPGTGLEMQSYALRLPEPLMLEAQALADSALVRNPCLLDQSVYSLLRRAVETPGLEILPSDLIEGFPSYAPDDLRSRYTLTFHVQFKASKWKPGIYMMWFGAQDRNWVSGPLLQGRAGPANSNLNSCFESAYPGGLAETRETAGSMRIFRVGPAESFE